MAAPGTLGAWQTPPLSLARTAALGLLFRRLFGTWFHCCRGLEEMVIGHLLVHHDLVPPRHDTSCPPLLGFKNLDEEWIVLRLIFDHLVPSLHLGFEHRLWRLDALNSLLGLHLYEVR